MLIGEPRTQRQHEQQRRHQQGLHEQQRPVRQRKSLEHVSADRAQRSRPPRRLTDPRRHNCAGVLRVVDRPLDGTLPDDDAHRGPKRRKQRGSNRQGVRR